MDIMSEREKGFEAKFAHDEEMQFKAIARRNKYLGLWAAGILGKSGEEATEYALEVVKADFREAGDEDVVRKLKEDLGNRVDEATIRRKMQEFLRQAKAELMGEVEEGGNG